MAGCYNHCYINALAAHAGIKLNFYNSILTSIESLSAMDRYLGIVLAQRWAPMNNNQAQMVLRRAEISKSRCEADLKRLSDILRNGCPNCILRHCNEQDQLPIISNEVIESLENLWAITYMPTPKKPNSPFYSWNLNSPDTSCKFLFPSQIKQLQITVFTVLYFHSSKYFKKCRFICASFSVWKFTFLAKNFPKSSTWGPFSNNE